MNHIKVNEVLENGESITDSVVMELLLKRTREFDVLHRGYVLEGFPMVTSDDISMTAQLEIISRMDLPPTYLIILQMQDKDLYKRRTGQKMDPATGKIYCYTQYSKYDPDELLLRRKYTPPTPTHNDGIAGWELTGSNLKKNADNNSGDQATEDFSDTVRVMSGEDSSRRFSRPSTPEHGHLLVSEIDFPKLSASVLSRLFFRTEDFNIIVGDDLESYRIALPELQEYVDGFDKRRVLEVDAYWSPTIIFRRVWDFCESVGLQPVPVPVQIMKPSAAVYYQSDPLGEREGEDDEETEETDEDDESDTDEELEGEDDDDGCEPDNTEIDWNAAMRAVCVRDLVDPRFRWRVSRWQQLCPVALKSGRSLPGKPELAASFMDKLFFLSTKHAVEQFVNNPRPYLLPKMPTSPIKFMILGHPLSGKTTFANELARITDASVIDMEKETTRRFPAVKKDILWKKRLKYSLEAANTVNRDNLRRWQRQEQSRRRDMHAWIENHLRSIAEAEIELLLARDKVVLHNMRIALRNENENHALTETYLGSGACQPSKGIPSFKWRKFILKVLEGKKVWTHQEILELAWELFHEKRLYYKRLQSKKIKRKMIKNFGDSSGSDEADASGETDEDDEETTSEGSVEIEDIDSDDDETAKKRSKRKKKKKPKKKCQPQIEIKPITPEDIVEPFIFETFEVDPDDTEVEESIRMRFPTIPYELVDIVPRPSLVGDLDPVVQMIVEQRLHEDMLDLETITPDLFVEVLKLAVAEAEIKFRKKNKHGALSGGWIIDNFPAEIEKWRAVVRTPQVCPDQVFLLLDLSEGNLTIWRRFKKLYKILHPIPPEKATRLPSFERLTTAGEAVGDATASPDTTGIVTTPVEKRPSQVMTPEDYYPLEDVEGQEELDLPKTSLEFDDDARSRSQSPNFDEMDLVSRSHFMMSLLPKDDLIEVLSMTSSEKELQNRDLRRHQTEAFSDCVGSDEDQMKVTMKGHEKYVLEASEDGDKNTDELDEAISRSSSVDNSDLIKKKRFAEQMAKKVYGEMVVCGDNLDNLKLYNDDRSDSGGSGFSQDVIMKNPPATPEAGRFSDDDSTGRKARYDAVFQPDALAITVLLDKRDDEKSGEDDIKTPSEMGASPVTTQSLENFQNPIYQKLASARIESPKRRFFTQIRLFTEFWNMALPVCNQENVWSSEIGLCDAQTAMNKAISVWTEMESRFDSQAKRILEAELREEDEEILESMVKWGQPFPNGDSRYRDYKGTPDRPTTVEDSEATETDSGDDDSSEEESQGLSSAADNDELTRLENNPLEYWAALRRRQAERCFGDFKFYCPVTFADFNVLRKGSSHYACKYKDRLYYCDNDEAQLRFISNPRQFLSLAGPPCAPPPRICITGSPGCLQEEIAQELCKQFGVCYVNFRERLHEIVYARCERPVGPENTLKIVPKADIEEMLKNSKPGDDLLNYYGGEDDEDDDEDMPHHIKFSSENMVMRGRVREGPMGILKIPSQEIFALKEQTALQEATLKSLGLLSQHNIATVPLNSFDRTEMLTNRKWKKLTQTETYLRAFLETGQQLPDSVLDQFILPLWTDKPFTKEGFILVGFPNTPEDIQYLVKRNCFPEHVFLMECKSVAIRNRLIVPAVDKYHKTVNPSGKKEKKLTESAKKRRKQLEAMRAQVSSNDPFQYQTEGRQEDEDDYVKETWTYNDAVSRDIGRALRYFHQIYSSGIEKMKKSLNKERFQWTPVDTNTGIYAGKHKVLDEATPILKYRSNVFEDVVRLSLGSAHSLLDRGVFSLSHLERWCPVEISKGNNTVNLWNASGIKKIPYLHRRYIYFIAGEKNAKVFEENTLELVNQSLDMKPSPLVCIILGKPKSGKTTLAKQISEQLGLLYVSLQVAVESVLNHEFSTQWADVLYEINPALASSGHQPMVLATECSEYIREGRAVPRFLVYRCLDLYLMNPKAQTNGVVFDDFPVLEDELIELNYREMTPCVVLKLDIPQEEAYARCERQKIIEKGFDEVPPDGQVLLDMMCDKYFYGVKETLRWFMEEYHNVFELDGTDSSANLFETSTNICVAAQQKVQNYLKNLLVDKPNTMDGICPITSTLFNRLNQDFGFYCPVSLNDFDELKSVKSIEDLKQVVEYKGEIFLFSSKSSVKKFLSNPHKYTVPGCLRTPPKDIPRKIQVSPDDFKRMNEHWGFMDFDPVLYYANHQ